MNYQRIAEQVHELVSLPNNLMSREQRLNSFDLTKNEFISMQSVFSKLEVSGDVLTFEIIPLDFW